MSCNGQNMKFKRRTLLIAGISSPALSVFHGRALADTFSLEDFLTLSSRLTHYPVAQLNVTAATALLKAFEAKGLGPELAKLAANYDSDDKLAAEVVSGWYTGICQTATGPVAIIFEEALLWKTATFLHPWSICGGATNYWALPPAA
jgi:hypothetical protein